MQNKQNKKHLKRLKRKNKLANRGDKMSAFMRKRINDEYLANQVKINAKLKQALGIPESEEVSTAKLVEAMNLRAKMEKEGRTVNPPLETKSE